MGPDEEEFLSAVGLSNLSEQQKRIADEALGRKQIEGDRIHKQAELYISVPMRAGKKTVDGVAEVIHELHPAAWSGLTPHDEPDERYFKEPFDWGPHIAEWEIKGHAAKQSQVWFYDLLYTGVTKRHCGHIPKHTPHEWELGSGYVKVKLACMGERNAGR